LFEFEYVQFFYKDGASFSGKLRHKASCLPAWSANLVGALGPVQSTWHLWEKAENRKRPRGWKACTSTFLNYSALTFRIFAS